MSKYLVIHGHSNMSPKRHSDYRILDFIMLDPKKDQELQMRKYVYRYFFEKENCGAKSLKNDIFKNKRIFIDINDNDFSGEVCTFEHMYNRKWLSFIPLEKIVNADYKKYFEDDITL